MFSLNSQYLWVLLFTYNFHLTLKLLHNFWNLLNCWAFKTTAVILKRPPASIYSFSGSYRVNCWTYIKSEPHNATRFYSFSARISYNTTTYIFKKIPKLPNQHNAAKKYEKIPKRNIVIIKYLPKHYFFGCW